MQCKVFNLAHLLKLKMPNPMAECVTVLYLRCLSHSYLILSTLNGPRNSCSLVSGTFRHVFLLGRRKYNCFPNNDSSWRLSPLNPRSGGKICLFEIQGHPTPPLVMYLGWIWIFSPRHLFMILVPHPAFPSRMIPPCSDTSDRRRLIL